MLIVSPCLPPGAGVAGAMILGVIRHALVDIVTGPGLQAQASP